MKDLQIATLSAAALFFLQDAIDIVGHFYGNEWKIILFLATSFLFLTKNPNYPDFWSDPG